MKKIYTLILIITLADCLQLSAQTDKPRYRVETHRAGLFLGNIDIELFPSFAPKHTNNFDSLVNMQFFDSTAFHRVVPGFVIQGGDPNSINGPISTWGFGQPWQVTVPAEFSVARHYRGRIGAARDADTNSATSQYYICVANAFSLDGQYTVYGQVTAGLDIVDTIVSTPRDINDVPLQKIEMFVTYTGVNDTVPADPVLSLPADLAVNVPGGIVFQWSSVSDAVIYTLQISTDPAFNTIQIIKKAGVNSTAVAGLQPNTSYYWRVQADNGGHQSNWSTAFSFSTGGPAQLIYPADSAVNVPVSILFQWTVVPNITTYNLQIDADSTFSLPLTGNYNGISTNSKQVNNLPASTPLYWRVRYFNGSVAGFFSERHIFTTGTATGIDELYKNGGAYIKNIYPVPADGNLTVELSASSNSGALLYIKDISGKEVVYARKVSMIEDGSIILETSHLKAGVYLLTVFVEGMEETRRIEIR